MKINTLVIEAESFLLFLLIFLWGFFLGICLPLIFKNFSTKIKFSSITKIKKWLFLPKICHCGLTKKPPYCDKSHPFAWRCFRWWRWINDNLDERDKKL
ncbi:hypothetical protein EBU71_05285 [bacterium]|nr:hypothetical protein [Candidatus Elulimicrobium humile]